MQREVPAASSREISSLVLKRSVYLSAGHSMLRVDPDGTVASLHSTKYGKLLFGRGGVEPFKVQSGVIISQRARELGFSLSPSVLRFSSRGQEQVGASHTLRLCGDQSTGYVRQSRFTNRSDAPLRLRILTIQDPTTLNFRPERDAPAEIGVNAFNRGDHVVMDDAGDTTGVRVVGFSPQPGAIYLTRSKQRALEVLAGGDLPETTAGMSGAILLLSQHDAEIPAGGAFELEVTSLYHGSSLEVALSELRSRAPSARTPHERGRPTFRCSNPSLNFSFAWAGAAIDSVERTTDLLDRISSGPGVSILRPELFEREFLELKGYQSRDGMVRHSSAERGGPLETSLFVINAFLHLSLVSDRKLARRWYPALRKAGNALRKAASDGLIVTPPGSPDGWRRRLRSGYPTGCVSEVNFAASGALACLSTLARSLNKGNDASAFGGASEAILRSVDGRLREVETGKLALNLDPRGRLHAETTVDQAVALSYSAPDTSLASSIVRRLLEKDFETGYGPRCVSRSNNLYYSPDYGEGQLGGYWTRASLAHAILAFSSGQPAIGSAQLEKVSALVGLDCEKMGGVPGEFPYWLDADRMQMGSVGSDTVAASRFVQALLVGELGMRAAPGRLSFNLPDDSRLRWLLLSSARFGGGGSIFAGRTSSGTFVATSFVGAEVPGLTRHEGSEFLETAPPIDSVVFWDNSSLLICAGNASNSRASGTVSVRTRGRPLASSLFVDVQEYDQERMSWGGAERRRLPESLEMRVELQPNSWKAYRAVRMA